jgi:hypothetical protein
LAVALPLRGCEVKIPSFELRNMTASTPLENSEMDFVKARVD